jgi:hypothetical protein
VKVTNISSMQKVFLKDLKITHASQTEGRRSEERYLGPGAFVYLPNTSEVLRSATHGDIQAFVQKGILKLEDEVELGASGDEGDSVTLIHNFRYAPAAMALKKVSDTWVDATGTIDVSHNEGFTETTVTNTTDSVVTFLIRLL